VNRQKSLRLACCFEPSHLTFSLSRRLMRHFSAVVSIASCVVIHGWHDAPVSGTVTLQLVRHQPPRRASLPVLFQYSIDRSSGFSMVVAEDAAQPFLSNDRP
jgi:hypothetical protein